MIVIARNFGQLGNRLLLSAHLIAAAREYGVPLLNPSFAEYASYFPSTASDLWCRYPAADTVAVGDFAPPSDRTRKLTYKAVYLSGKALLMAQRIGVPTRILRLQGNQICDLDTDRFRALAQSSVPLLVSGWQFRSQRLLNLHADAVRDHYAIAPAHRTRVNELITHLRSQSDIIVGVHIRHGDYAEFENGKYFFSLNEYVDVMRRVREQLGGRRVAFLVCSNSKLDASGFGDLKVHFGTGHLVEDMYSFADTDLLFGPPSTFTGWASFYGKTPLQVLQRADQKFDVSSMIPQASCAA